MILSRFTTLTISSCKIPRFSLTLTLLSTLSFSLSYFFSSLPPSLLLQLRQLISHKLFTIRRPMYSMFFTLPSYFPFHPRTFLRTIIFTNFIALIIITFQSFHRILNTHTIRTSKISRTLHRTKMFISPKIIHKLSTLLWICNSFINTFLWRM